MRIFLALEINDQWKRELARVQRLLMTRTIKARPIAAENLHLTIQFIGETNDISALIRALDELSLNRVKLLPKGLSSFKRRGEELVFLELVNTWELRKLNEEVRKVLDKLSIAYDEKKFLAHISILRRAIFEDGFELDKQVLKLDSLEITGMVLMESKLDSKGASYRNLKKFILSG